MRSVTACLVFSVLASTSSQAMQDAEQKDVASTKKQKEHAAKVAAAVALGDLKATLKPLNITPRQTGPLWSPKGTKVPLKKQGDDLVGKLDVGKIGSFKVQWSLPKEPGGAAKFSIDTNADGRITADETTTVEAKERRGAYWYDEDRELRLPSKRANYRPYPLNLWYVVHVEGKKKDEPPVMRWSRRGWTEGEVMVGKRKAVVVMSERRHDGLFTKDDSWGIGFNQRSAYSNSLNRLSSHAWLDGVAYEPIKFDDEGASIAFKAVDVGMTQQEERKRKDPYAADKKLARAKKPVRFGKNLDEALAIAKRDNKLVFVDFVTTWCGPCKSMDLHVYTAAPVVRATDEFVSIKLDGDEVDAIVEKYEVTGYPTLLVLDADGAVLGRTSGYTSAARLMNFLKTAKKAASKKAD